MSFVDVLTVVIVFIVTDQVTRRLRIFYRRNWPAYKKRRGAGKRYAEAFQVVFEIIWPDKNVLLKINREFDLQIALKDMGNFTPYQHKYWTETRRSFQKTIDEDLRHRAERVYFARLNQKAARDKIDHAKRGLRALSSSQLDELYKNLRDTSFIEDVTTKVFWRHHDAAALLGFKTYPDIWAHRALKV